jgi:hypothetical protein
MPVGPTEQQCHGRCFPWRSGEANRNDFNRIECVIVGSAKQILEVPGDRGRGAAFSRAVTWVIIHQIQMKCSGDQKMRFQQSFDLAEIPDASFD